MIFYNGLRYYVCSYEVKYSFVKYLVKYLITITYLTIHSSNL